MGSGVLESDGPPNVVQVRKSWPWEGGTAATGALKPVEFINFGFFFIFFP